jgi:hypothetical protein
MATTTAYQCDACKKILQPTEGIRIEGKIFQININNRFDEILVKIRGGKELDLCPICFWRSMSAKFKNQIQEDINNSRG